MARQIKRTVKKIKSVVPVYIVGFIWLLYALIFPMYRMMDFLIVAVLSAVGYVVASILIPVKEVVVEEVEELKPVITGNPDADEILSTGRDYIMELSALTTKVQNKDIREKVTHMDSVSRKIYDFLGKHPEKAKQVRMFTNYYLPTTLKLLENYTELEAERDIAGQNIMESTRRIEEAMTSFTDSYEKLLDNLYQDKAMDIQADITVLESMMAKQGTASENKALEMARESQNIGGFADIRHEDATPQDIAVGQTPLPNLRAVKSPEEDSDDIKLSLD